ncbi:LysR family transcriptional regulator [Roseomonas sp. CECT 9278]|uniref:helix-turn-helix domain-containing protein n=1 Tax=Roseomonas sp. CECT 9278 TaxID=2845823 RepID=UPI001E5EC2FE|nr:LysR family transcriptional regulator [Roseomonas sp. CECT 9278]CAH0232708.1 hypothetical protein ROS9278_02693 [Roseomonas sp. CECT 9278]
MAATDTPDLRVRDAVARRGGMGRAAAVLDTVPSNGTARIRALAAERGVALFGRHNRGCLAGSARTSPWRHQVIAHGDGSHRFQA